MAFLTRRTLAPAALVASAVLALSACGGSPTTGSGSTPTAGTAAAKKLNVVVAFYPLQFIAERVAGDTATVTNLTQPGTEAHDLELTPRQVAALSEADLVIYQKGFQGAVDKAIEQAKPANVLDVSTVVKFHQVNAAGEEEHDHDHDHEEGATSAPAHTEDDDEHDHGGVDPHVWLDPNNMVTMTQAAAEAFGKARPADQATFTANATAVQGQLTSLDGSFRTGLATCQRKEFVTSHAAFGYLADQYNLVQIPIRGLSPDNEPAPARIAEVQQLVQQHGITTIFYETLVSPAVSESIARDLNLKTDVLDPLEGITEQSRGKDYIEVMNANLTALKAANGCS